MTEVNYYGNDELSNLLGIKCSWSFNEKTREFSIGTKDYFTKAILPKDVDSWLEVRDHLKIVLPELFI